MTEIQWYLVNGFVLLLAFMAFTLLRSWYSALEHQYRIYARSDEAEKLLAEIRRAQGSFPSKWEIERAKETLAQFDDAARLKFQLEHTRKILSECERRIKELESKVRVLSGENG